jgi:TonB-dependent receptor
MKRYFACVPQLSLFLIILFDSTAYAQSPKGTVVGRVTDTGGGVLQGARAELEPGNAVAISNNQGEFRFIDVTPGPKTITVSFVGFTKVSKQVDVAADGVTRADATMEVGSVSEQVLVTAERPHGEAEAINRQRTAENILQVLPAEVITSLPNANVADAIGRLPSVTLERDEGEGKYVQIRGAEPRYSNVTVDGVNVASPESVRQIKLDIVPSDLVESVEINKTLLANMDGDAIGGSVNLRTKTAGEQPTVSLFGLGGYTPIFNGRGEDQFGGTIGKRFGKEKRLGLLFGGTYDWNGRGIDDVEPAPQAIQCIPGDCGNATANAPYFATYAGAGLREYRYYRARYGFSGSADYKFSDRTNMYIRGLYSHFDNFGDRWEYAPTINSYTTSALQGGPDGQEAFDAQIRRPVQTVGSMAAGGQHYFGNSWITFELSASRGSTEDQGYSTTNFGPVADNSPLNNIQFGVDLTNPYRPRFPVQNGVNIYDSKQYFLQNLDFNRYYSPQVNLQGGASLARNYSLNGHYGTFEMGGKVRNAHKFQNANDVYYDAVSPDTLPMTLFLSGLQNNNFYGNSYQLGSFVNYDKVRSYFTANPGAFAVNTQKTLQRNEPQKFNLLERVYAGYIQNSINFGKWRLYAGLRLEATDENVRGNTVVIDKKGKYVSTTGITNGSGYIDPLPSVQLRYAITPESGIRAAYGRGLARPNFSDLPPYTTVNDRRNSISAGNPDLQPTYANNYDLLYEHYLKPLGVFEAGLFYKDISQPIYFVNSAVPSGSYAGFRQTQPVNGSSAYLWGFEASYQQRLAYLPGALNALGISANYSYTASRANGVPGRADHPSLQRQAPHTWNISPTYDKGRVSMRVGMTYNSENIFQYNFSDGAPLGIKGPNGDVYLYPHLQIDAQASIRLSRGFSAIVYGLNLNNEVFGFYQGSGIYPIQREYYRTTIAAGLRWSLPVAR